MEADLELSSPDSAAFRHQYCRGQGVEAGSGTEGQLTTPLFIAGSELTMVTTMIVAAFFKFAINLDKMTFIYLYN